MTPGTQGKVELIVDRVVNVGRPRVGGRLVAAFAGMPSGVTIAPVTWEDDGQDLFLTKETTITVSAAVGSD